MLKTLENRFYYLDNFHTVIDWISERYRALLIDEEMAFIERFKSLPQPSRALLVRMVMRKGELFRASKLCYDEIGCTKTAAQPLLEQGWIDDQPLLTLEQLFALLKKPEIVDAFGLTSAMAAARKADQLEMLRAEFSEPRKLANWYDGVDECVYQLLITPLCERFRLMFFGNLRQDWTEFVLSDLGVFQYETIALSAASQAFRQRSDVDVYLHLHLCRERFDNGEPVDDVLRDLPPDALDNAWLEGRRAKLMFGIAQQMEQQQEWQRALSLYASCQYAGSRLRMIRVLERCEQIDQAFALAGSAEELPESEAESQQLLRIMPRLRRKLGLAKVPARAALPVERLELELQKPETTFYVEEVVRGHVDQDAAPAYYVENTLINSLFGLLCWPAIFAAVPGAFFHPFHTGPADLHAPDFHLRRKQEFVRCLEDLDSERYKETIRKHYSEKTGIQSPFVAWGILNEELLDHALKCIPAMHLRKCFERILRDIPSNRAGFPDLVQFWPQEKRYRMIEVKGPGDRLQDNQIRWLEYFREHDIPVAVCYVQWMEPVT